MMELNRRAFIASAGSAALVASVAPSFALPRIIDPRIAAIKAQFTKYFQWELERGERLAKRSLDKIGDSRAKMCEFAEKVCHAMVDLRPDAFIDQVMSGPTTLIVWPNRENLHPLDYQFVTATCGTRSYKWQTNTMEGWTPQLVAEQLFEEVDKEDRRVKQWWATGAKLGHAQHLEKLPKAMHEALPPQRIWYIPAYLVRAIDPNSYMPKVGMKLRYGYTFGGTRVMRWPEDDKLERARSYELGRLWNAKHV